MSTESAPEGEASSGNGSADNSSNAECPTCGRDDFKNTHGMKIHHSEVHGESIAGVESECEYCGGTYRTHPTHESTTRFCSNECHGDWMSENVRGEDHPMYSKVEVPCETCGETVRRKKSHYEQTENTFCSYSCHREYQSIHQVGENHHNYGGGRAEKYGPNWDNQAEKCRARDGYECQICGTPQEDHFRALTAHHLTPRKEFIDEDGNYDYERANRLVNLITLCASCHQKWEGIPLRPQ